MSTFAPFLAAPGVPMDLNNEITTDSGIIAQALNDGINAVLLNNVTRRSKYYDIELYVEIELSGDTSAIAGSTIDFAVGTEYDPLDENKANLLTSVIPQLYSTNPQYRIIRLQFRTMFDPGSAYGSIMGPAVVYFFAVLNRQPGDNTVYTLVRTVTRTLEEN